jgi:hypothetical protein
VRKRSSYRPNSVVLVTFILLLCVVSLVRKADAQPKFTSFDFPGAVNTQATGIWSCATIKVEVGHSAQDIRRTPCKGAY